MKQEAVRRFEDARDAVIVPSQLVVAAGELARVIHKAADKQVQPTVVIVVKPYRARSPARQSQSGLIGHVGERSVAVVVVQNATSVSGDEQVRISVVVIVAYRYTHAESGARGDAGLFRYISERAVAIILVERVARRLQRFIEIRWTAVHQVQIHPAVVVIIEECAAWTECLGEIPFGRHGVLMHPSDTAHLRRDLLENR